MRKGQSLVVDVRKQFREGERVSEIHVNQTKTVMTTLSSMSVVQLMIVVLKRYCCPHCVIPDNETRNSKKVQLQLCKPA